MPKKKVLLPLLPLAVLARGAWGQSYAGGLGKVTWASSEPDTTCLAFFTAFLPGVSLDANECANDTCPCGRQGRVKLDNVTGGQSGLDALLKPWMDADAVAGINSFGVHTVACDHHPSGPLGVATLEAALQAAWGDMSSYDPSMDLNAGFWVPDLGPVAANLSGAGYPLHGSTWTADDNGAEYWSVLVNPCGLVLLEFVSNVSSVDVPGLSFAPSLPRFWFDAGRWNAPVRPDAPLTPIKASRAVTTDTLDAAAGFYVRHFGAAVLRNLTFAEDGTRVVEVQLPSATTFRSGDFSVPIDPPTSPAVTLQFWARSPTRPAAGAWGVAALQRYLVAANAKLIRSPSCGFTRWLDVHASVDCWDDQACNTTKLARSFTAHGVPFRWIPYSPMDTDGQYMLYAIDPTGFGVETHFWTSVVPEDARPDDDALPPDCFSKFDNGTCPGDNGTCS